MTSFRRDDIVGKTVIETSGNILGKVKDVLFDLNDMVTLIIEDADGRDSRVPLTRVTGISQHVVVKSVADTGPSASGVGSVCKFCGASVPPRQKWCPNCGKAQS